MPLVLHFQKGTSCRGKYALFGLVWFGGKPNQLQSSPSLLELSIVSTFGSQNQHKSSQKQSDYRGVLPGSAENTAKKLVDLR